MGVEGHTLLGSGRGGGEHLFDPETQGLQLVEEFAVRRRGWQGRLGVDSGGVYLVRVVRLVVRLVRSGIVQTRPLAMVHQLALKAVQVGFREVALSEELFVLQHVLLDALADFALVLLDLVLEVDVGGIALGGLSLLRPPLELLAALHEVLRRLFVLLAVALVLFEHLQTRLLFDVFGRETLDLFLVALVSDHLVVDHELGGHEVLDDTLDTLLV